MGEAKHLYTAMRRVFRIVRLTPSAIEAQQLGQEAVISCALVPATQLPESLWPLLVERATVAVIASLDGDVIHYLSLSVIPLVVKKGTVVVRQGEEGAVVGRARGVGPKGQNGRAAWPVGRGCTGSVHGVVQSVA